MQTTDNAQTHQETYGTKAVGLTFNPSGDPKVQQIKSLYAQIIDLLHEDITPTGNGMGDKLRDTAEQQAILAQMAAVKYVTWK